MTSRTTKQAARAYQKAHGVPYAEALRIVMGSDEATDTRPFDGPPHPSQVFRDSRPIENPTTPVLGEIGQGQRPDQDNSPRIVLDPLHDLATPQDLLDKHPDLNEHTALIDLGGTSQLDPFGIEEEDHTQVTGRASGGKYVPDPESTEVFPGGPWRGKSTPNWPILPERIILGHLPMPASTLLVDATPVPVTWNLRQRATHSYSPTLGVYGNTYGVGKSFYLASLVRANLTGVPTLVVTAHPSNYPQHDGLTYYVPDRDASGPADPEAVLAVAAERGARAVVYDDAVGAPTEAAETLRTLTGQAQGMLLLFVSYEDGPGEIVPDVTISPAAAMSVPHTRGVFQAAFGDESPVQMAPTLDHELRAARAHAESPNRAT